MIEIREGDARVELESTETRLMSGALTVRYSADDLLLAVVRLLDAIGDRRAEDVRRLLQA